MTKARYVIVELFDDAIISPQKVAEEIVNNLEDVKEAQPAAWNGFNFVMRGDVVRGEDND